MTATFHAAAPVAISAILAAANANGQGAFDPDSGKFVLGSSSAQTLKGGTSSDVIVSETGQTNVRGGVDGGADKVTGDRGDNLVTVGYNDKVTTGKGDDRIVLGITRAPTANIDCGKGSDRVVVERNHDVKADSVRKRLSSCEKVTFEYGSL
ncbi:MAG: hypothetical protein JHC95_23720, partial [Solirubrobacteraceae bacterium]|nr:hypothetical protein [Solirubrobacteraceae bacterium]